MEEQIAELVAQVAVLPLQRRVGLEPAQQFHGLCHRNHGPFHVGHNPIHQIRPEPFRARAVDPPNQKDAQQAQNDDPQQQSAQRGRVVIAL